MAETNERVDGGTLPDWELQIYPHRHVINLAEHLEAS